jgi:hypothetical protein
MSLQQNRRADRVNRTVLTVMGVVGVAAGGAALAAGAGAFGDDTAGSALLGSSVQDALDDHGAWIALVAAVVLAVVGALAAAWLLYLLRPAPQIPDLRLVTDADGTPDRAHRDPEQVPGRISIDPKALAVALERDLQALAGVADASVRLPDRRPVEVHALLSLHEGVEVAPILRAVADQVRPRMTDAIGVADVHVLVEVRPIAERPSRVA